MFPKLIPNWLNGREVPAISGQVFNKLNPHNGIVLCQVTRSYADDIESAVKSAKDALPDWSATPAVQRGLLLHKLVIGMQNNQEEIARIVAAETG